jgi:putative tricarboxylic transport membrane protein
MQGETVEFLIHGPPGSAPPALAAAFRDGVAEAGLDARRWALVDRGGDPGVDAMATLFSRPGDTGLLSTCTPVFLQAPLLRGMAQTHRGLTPLVRLVADRYVIVVRADAPWQTAADFLSDLARRSTRSGGYFRGGINHLLALAVAEAARGSVEFVLVPEEPAVWTALIEGRIDWAVGTPVEVLPHVEAGTFRALAALDHERLGLFPDTPTLREAGADVTFKLWRGLIGPPGLSVADQQRWHALAAAAVKTNAWRTYLARNGQTDDFLPGDDFRAFLEEEWAWYEKHLGLAGLLPRA